MEEAFTAGIRPGGLTDGGEIRILICHILASADSPMSFDELTEAVLSDGAANYFEFSDALAELENTGCVLALKSPAGISEYSLTEKGKTAAATLGGKLPASIKEKSTEATANILRRRRIEKENLVSITRTEDGFKVHMRVTDIGTDLMELSLFMPDEEMANAVRERFLSDPAETYSKVLEALAGKI